MKGYNFIWAVRQMGKGKKVTRLECFGQSGCEYLKMDDGFIFYFSKEIRGIALQYLDYLAKDWVLWEK